MFANVLMRARLAPVFCGVPPQPDFCFSGSTLHSDFGSPAVLGLPRKSNSPSRRRRLKRGGEL
jgi:hypothetical protein